MSRLFASGGQSIWSFSIRPSSEYSGLISFRIDWFDLLAVQGTLRNLLNPFHPSGSLPFHPSVGMIIPNLHKLHLLL